MTIVHSYWTTDTGAFVTDNLGNKIVFASSVAGGEFLSVAQQPVTHFSGQAPRAKFVGQKPRSRFSEAPCR